MLTIRGRALAAATLACLAAAVQATDYREGAIITGSYVDPANGGTSGTCVRTNATTTTCTSYREAHDLPPGALIPSSPTVSSPAGTVNIGALTAGANFISGATIPYGPVANAMTGELAYQDNDFVTFVVPTGYALSNLFVVAPSAADPDGTVITQGDQLFLGIARGASVNVTLPSSVGLLGYTLVSSSAIGTDILPALGASSPPGFSGPPFSGATTFSGALSAGTCTLWMLDGDRPVSYKFNLQLTAVPEPAS